MIADVPWGVGYPGFRLSCLVFCVSFLALRLSCLVSVHRARTQRVAAGLGTNPFLSHSSIFAVVAMRLLSLRSLAISAILLCLFSAAGLAQSSATKAEKEHEGDVREREAFFYDRLVSGVIKDVAEIRRIGAASFSSMSRSEAFRQEQMPTWTSVSSSVSSYASGRVRSIAFDPVQPNALYIAATVGGLWKTDDITAPTVSWRCLSDNLPTSVCTSIAISKSDANTIYLGTGETYPGYVASVGMGIFKSEDKGLNWKNVLSEKTMGLTCAQIAVDASNPNNVFVAAPGDYYSILKGNASTNGLFHSVDGGAHWVNAGLPAGIEPVQVSIDPINSKRVYAAGFKGDFYRSVDGGYTWINSVLPYEYSGGSNPALVVSQSSPNILFLSAAEPNYYTSGGIYTSVDNGVTWSIVNDCASQSGSVDPEMLGRQGFYADALAVDESDPTAVYAGGLDVYGSVDGASTFAQYSNSRDYPDSSGYSHADIHVLASRNGKLYCGSDGGISIYENGGWNNKSNKGLSTLQFINVDADQALTHFVGGTQDNGTLVVHPHELDWTSTHGGDGGNAWVSPVNGNIVYGTYTYTYIFRSDDAGKNWSDANFQFGGLVTNTDLLNERAPFYAAYDVSPDGSIVAFGGYQHVYVSRNGGQDGFAQEGQQTIGTAYSVLVSPTNSQKMWTGSKSAIWHSTDMGLNWSRAGVPVSGNIVGIVTGATDTVLYAVAAGISGDSNNHFIKSTNGGVSWNKVATNFPSLPVNSIARSSSGQLFVGTDYGVITSTNGGVTWSPFGLGMPLVQVLSLKVKGAGQQYLLAGTHGRGAYTIPIPQASVAPVQSASFRLQEVSPNPVTTNQSATLSFEMDRSQDATVTLYDALGRELRTVAKEHFSQGPHTLSLPISNLISGEYFVVLSGADASLSKKFVIAK